MLPGVLMVLFFVYIPVLMNIVYSFFRLSSFSAESTFVGLDNYRRFFSDDVFPIMLKNNVAYCIISLIVQVGFGTVLALILESNAIGSKMRDFFRNLLSACPDLPHGGGPYVYLYLRPEYRLPEQPVKDF